MGNKLYFIFKNHEFLLNIKNKSIVLPNDDDIKTLGISLINEDFLTKKDNSDYYFGEISADLKLTGEFKFYRLRSLIGSIDILDFNLAAKALHLIQWNNTIKYCNKCGSLVKDKEDERAKICPQCGYISYPRISPAIITAIVKDNKLLLAHNATFKNGMHSLIAGFVEPGETFEDCVAREVFEEVRLNVKNIRYFGTQPWPFPDSLMIGFTCEYESGELEVDGLEIDHAAFYGADEFPNIPLPGTIARKLIDWFVDSQKTI